MDVRYGRPKWLGLRTELAILFELLWYGFLWFPKKESVPDSDAERPALHLVTEDSTKPKIVG